MTGSNSSKNKDKKKAKIKLEKKLASLKSLQSEQKKKPEPSTKSLNSLKKIQTQLDDLIKQRKKEKKLVKALKKNSQSITNQLETIDSRLPELALNSDLQQIKIALKTKDTQFQHNNDKLTREISLFQDLIDRVELKIQALEKENIPNQQQFLNLDQNQERLFEKISQFEHELKQISDELAQPEPALADFIDQLNQLSQLVTQLNDTHQAQDGQIKLLQTDTANIRKSLQQVQAIDNQMADLKPRLDDLDKQNQQLTEQTQKIEQQSEHQYSDLHNKISLSEKAQHSLFTPLEAQLKQLEANIESLNQDYIKQQQSLTDDAGTLSDLTTRVGQFDEILQQSQNELKEHIQQLRQSDEAKQSEHFSQFTDKLEKFSQQLADVAQQSSDLQTQFEQLQAQQSSASDHHDELSSQYLTQQQQLQNHDSELAQLNPLIEQNKANEQQVDQITQTLEQLASAQNTFVDLDKERQSSLTTLAQKLDDSHLENQLSINEIRSQQQEAKSHQQGLISDQQELKNHQQKLNSQQQEQKNHQQDLNNRQQKFESHQQAINHHQQSINGHQQEQTKQQQEQAVILAQHGDQIKTRSQLFSIGLITVLTVSSLLFFYQNTPQSDSDRQVQIAQIKTDITNETFTKINNLTKQNSDIINEQLNQIRSSILKVKQTEQPLKNNWQAPYQLLQEDVATIKTTQQTLGQSVSKLSNEISFIAKQVQQSPEPFTQRSGGVAEQKQKMDLREVTDIKSVTRPFYTIQLLGVEKKDSIAHFLKHHNLADRAQLYQTELQKKPWYILIYGNYASYSQARKQLQQLPEPLLKHRPWIRKIP